MSSDPVQEFWDFRETAQDAAALTTALTEARTTVEAGGTLPPQVVLALIDTAIQARSEHLQGTQRQIYKPGDEYQVCLGCGKQVMSVYDPQTGAVRGQGTCYPLRLVDFVLTTALHPAQES